MITALIGFVIGALVAAVVAILLLRRARADAGESEEGAEVAAARAELAELRLRALRDTVPFVALRLDGTGRLVEVNRLARERFPFLPPGMGVLEAFSEHTLARGWRRRPEPTWRRGSSTSACSWTAGAPTGRPWSRMRRGRPRGAPAADRRERGVDYQELRSQFVANVSHELRTPLTGLRGLLEALADPRWTRTPGATSWPGPRARPSGWRR